MGIGRLSIQTRLSKELDALSGIVDFSLRQTWYPRFSVLMDHLELGVDACLWAKVVYLLVVYFKGAHENMPVHESEQLLENGFQAETN
jgi:hypothetical protein